MSEIIKKVLSKSSVPLLSDEGLREVVEYYATKTLSKGYINISRHVKISSFKQHKIEEVDADRDLIYGKEVFSYLLNAIKQEIDTVGIENYMQQVMNGKNFIINENFFEDSGEYIPQKEDVLQLLSIINIKTIDEILKESKLARAIFSENAILSEDHTGKIQTLPYFAQKQKSLEGRKKYDF